MKYNTIVALFGIAWALNTNANIELNSEAEEVCNTLRENKLSVNKRNYNNLEEYGQQIIQAAKVVRYGHIDNTDSWKPEDLHSEAKVKWLTTEVNGKSYDVIRVNAPVEETYAYYFFKEKTTEFIDLQIWTSYRYKDFSCYKLKKLPKN